MGTASNVTIELQSGTLGLNVERAEMSLHELCGFASRRSRKRGFVFVSKVLGKHIPARPRYMAEVHRRLANKLANIDGPAIFVAMAETATGLGHGVFDLFLLFSGRCDVLLIQGTRYRLRQPLAIQFEEAHSHATRHLLYQPVNVHDMELFRQARTLVLIDDEISTGRTLGNLALALLRDHKHLSSIELVSITDWLSDRDRRSLQHRLSVPVRHHSLLNGQFEFTAHPDFDPGPLPDVCGKNDFKDHLLAANFGRLGISTPLHIADDVQRQCAAVTTEGRVLVLGTGEFAYPPFLLAQKLAAAGKDVWFQTTTRSPLLVERDLQSAIEFRDNYGDDIPNYVYNLANEDYDRILICYETAPLPPNHRLPQMVAGDVIHF